MSAKPPIGLMPKYLWEESHPSLDRQTLEARYSELVAAMKRFFDAGLGIPNAWKEEAKDLYQVLEGKGRLIDSAMGGSAIGKE